MISPQTHVVSQFFFWKRALGGLTAWGPIHQRGLKYHTRASKNNNRILVSLPDPTFGIFFSLTSNSDPYT